MCCFPEDAVALHIIRPMLTYGALVWYSKSVQKLFKKQRQACLSITGMIRTTSTSALKCVLTLPTLQYLLKKVARLATNRFDHSIRALTYMERRRELAEILNVSL